MRIVERTRDKLIIETAPDGWDKLIFAAPIVGSAAGFAAFGAWGLTFLSSILLLCVPVAILFIINFKSVFRTKHTYYLDTARNELLFRERLGSKTKQMRGTVRELKSLEGETRGTDPPRFYIVAKYETLPRTSFEVEELFSGDEAAMRVIESFLDRRAGN